MKTYKISEFAKLIGVSSETLRNWDKKGSFKAHKTPTGHRFYTHAQYEEYMGIISKWV